MSTAGQLWKASWGAVVAAYVQLAAEYSASDALVDDIAKHVKSRLAAKATR